jgi:hypothetical protein
MRRRVLILGYECAGGYHYGALEMGGGVGGVTQQRTNGDANLVRVPAVRPPRQFGLIAERRALKPISNQKEAPIAIASFGWPHSQIHVGSPIYGCTCVVL